MADYQISNMLFQSAAQKRVPINGSFELTADCNYNCKMCYVHNCTRWDLAKDIVGADKWIALFSECEKHGLLYALLTGGEPLVHPEFDKIYRAVIEKNIITVLNSNGYLIDDERIAFFKRYPPSRINVTLYGTSDLLYVELCGIRKGFTRVSGALRKLKDNGFNLSVNLTITKTNYPDLGNIIRFAKENGYSLRPTTYIFGTAPNCVEERLSPDDAARAALEIYRLTHTEAEFRKYIAGNLFRLKAGRKKAVSEMALPGITCRAGTASYWVHSDGKMNFCGMIADEDSPNVFELPFEQAWQDAVQKAAAVERCKICVTCADRFVCRKCHAMLRSEGVKPEDVEQSYACKYYKAFASEIMEIGKIYASVSDN